MLVVAVHVSSSSCAYWKTTKSLHSRNIEGSWDFDAYFVQIGAFIESIYSDQSVGK